MLKAENITVTYGSNTVLDKASFTLPESTWMMVAGPNGAGKSTLAKAVAQSVTYSGRIFADGVDIATFKPAQLAKKLGKGKRVVTVLPDTAERYFSTPLFLD